MYLSIDFVQDFLNTVDDVIPDKVWKKEKKLSALRDAMRTCVDTHLEDIRTGRGIVIGRDIQEVRYVTPIKPAKKEVKEKTKVKRKKRR